MELFQYVTTIASQHRAAPGSIAPKLLPRLRRRDGRIRSCPVPVPELPSSMSDTSERLTPADLTDLTAALAFALRYQGRKRVHNADEIMAEIVAKRLADHLERAGFVVMKRPAEVGAAALGRGFEG